MPSSINGKKCFSITSFHNPHPVNELGALNPLGFFLSSKPQANTMQIIAVKYNALFHIPPWTSRFSDVGKLYFEHWNLSHAYQINQSGKSMPHPN